MIGRKFCPMAENMRYYCVITNCPDVCIKLGPAIVREWARLKTDKNRKNK